MATPKKPTRKAKSWKLAEMGTPGQLAVSPDGAFLIASRGLSDGGETWRVDVASGEVSALAPARGLVSSISITGDGRHVLTFDGDEGRYVVCGADGRIEHQGVAGPHASGVGGPGHHVVLRAYDSSVLLDTRTGVTRPFEAGAACFLDAERLFVLGREHAFAATVGGKAKQLAAADRVADPLVFGGGRVLAGGFGGSGGWALLDAAKGSVVAQGEQGFFTAVAHGDGFLMLNAKKLFSLSREGELSAPVVLSAPHVQLVSGGGQVYALTRGKVSNLTP